MWYVFIMVLLVAALADIVWCEERGMKFWEADDELFR